MKNSHMISEMLGTVYQSRTLYRCISESLEIHPERLRILHDIVVNYDRMRLEDMESRTYRYGSMVMEDDLLARQVFLCLINLVNEKKQDVKENGQAER